MIRDFNHKKAVDMLLSRVDLPADKIADILELAHHYNIDHLRSPRCTSSLQRSPMHSAHP